MGLLPARHCAARILVAFVFCSSYLSSTNILAESVLDAAEVRLREVKSEYK